MASQSNHAELGDKVRCVLTGIEGIVTSRTEFLYGCVRLSIQPKEVKDGKPVEQSWVDEPQVEIIEKNALHRDLKPELVTKQLAYAHGPRDDARRVPDASR